MCGICGSYALRQPSDPGQLEASTRYMMGQMARRGPDDDGFWSDGGCALGFRRLAILDLAPTGHQPMITADERYVLIFNGEVYNFQELRPRLEQRRVQFRSTGDAEVILYALAEWGVKALEQFNGMFALAFYDRHTKQLLLARDHAGIKPLFYLHTDQGVVFASQYNQLLQHPWGNKQDISLDGLSLYLRFGYMPAPYTLHKQTFALDAGCWVRFSPDGRVEQGQFYAFPMFQEPTLRGATAVEALDQALSQAVSRHLISDVPVGVFLSGGIDSPLVAAEARRHTQAPIKAFSIGVPNSTMDESADAQQYAQELGLEHILWQIDETTAFRLLDDVIQASTEPNADFSIFPTLLVSQLAHEHVKVVLSGDGGDELFWGYPQRFGAVLEQTPYYRYPTFMRYGFIAARRYLHQGHATRDVLWRDIGRFYQKKHTIMSENDLVATFPGLSEPPSTWDMFHFNETEPQQTAQWLRWNEFRLHLARILQKVDRASMHHSLEVRVPLLDKEVIAVALATDWRSCLNLGQRIGKLPLRAVLRRRVQYQTTAKKGFTVPMDRWLIGPLQSLLQEKVLSQTDFLGQSVNRQHLQMMNKALLAGDSSRAWGLWLLLVLVLWQERHTVVRPQSAFIN